MVLTVFTSASVITRLHVIRKKEHASAHRVGQGHIAIYRVRSGHLARTASISVPVNPAMSRGLAISKMGHVFASLVTQEISMSITLYR